MNTLDSNRGCPSGALQTNESRTLDGPSPSKRRKTLTDNAARGPNEEISEIEHDQASSWREPQGSQASLAHSVSPGIPEYQTVEAAGKGAGRSNRRSRRPKPAHSLETIGSEPKPEPAPQLEDIDSFDELAPVPRPSKDRQRTARLVATGRTTSDMSISDPADAHILRGATAQSSTNRFRNPANHARKRPAHSAGDQKDEVMDVDRDTGDGSGAGDPAGESVTEDPKQKPASEKKATATSSIAAVIYGAICEPYYHCPLPNDSKGYGLYRTRFGELKVREVSGESTEMYDWLKVTRKVNTLGYNPECDIVKISQPADAVALTKGNMVIKFTENSGAMMVANWAREHLPSTKVVELSRY